MNLRIALLILLLFSVSKGYTTDVCTLRYPSTNETYPLCFGIVDYPLEKEDNFTKFYVDAQNITDFILQRHQGVPSDECRELVTRIACYNIFKRCKSVNLKHFATNALPCNTFCAAVNSTCNGNIDEQTLAYVNTLCAASNLQPPCCNDGVYVENLFFQSY